MILRDRTKETTATTGNGPVSLAGAAVGFQSFLAAVGNITVPDVPYCISTSVTGVEWEVGRGTFNGPALTLSRNTVDASSNAGNLVAFSAGIKDVFLTLAASVLDYAMVKNSIVAGESVHVSSGRQFICYRTLTNSGRIVNDGAMVAL